MGTDVERHMARLDDQELLRAVAVGRDSYTREALAAAEDESRRRSLPILGPDEYWKRFPGERMTPSGFCESCVGQTTEESPGSTRSMLPGFPIGLGTCLFGEDDPCPACGSIIQSKLLLVVVPVVRLGRYRVIYLGGRGEGQYIGRRLKPAAPTP
jgi:hypothetical protein